MPNISAGHFLGTEYNDFLFAPIGEDSNGNFLSVLSALVRLDVDPWQEAADLARLPFDAAVKRLSVLIMALPDQLSAHRDSGTIAARVIALLPPSRAASSIGPQDTVGGLDHRMLWVGLLGLTAAIMLTQAFVSARTTDPGTPSRAVVQQKLPLTSGFQK